MGTTATAKSGAPRVIVPAGAQIGRCYSVVDVGTQTRTFEGKARLRHEIRVSWEVPAVRVQFETEDGKKVDNPAALHKTYTLSLDEKATLRHDLESWRGRAFTPEELKGFDVKNVLGATALVTVTHKPKADGTGVYVNVTGVTKLMKGMTAPPAENKPQYYEVEMKRNDVFASFPDWLQEEIAACAEWRGPVNDEAVPQDNTAAAGPKDDIPF